MTLNVVYDLKSAPVTFDFGTFLAFSDCLRQLSGESDMNVSIIATGYRKQSPRDLSVSESEKASRIHGILTPLMAVCPTVSGFSVEYKERYDYQPAAPYSTPYTVAKVGELSIRGAEPRFMLAPDFALKVAPDFAVTLTPRCSRHFVERNCDLDSWYKFYERLTASGLNVVVIPDRDNLEKFDEYSWNLYQPAAWDISLRAAVYQKARMNIISATGPAIVLFFSKKPFIIFDILAGGVFSREHWAAMNGCEDGGKPDFLGDDQIITWTNSTYNNLRDEFNRYRLPAWPEIDL